MSLAKYSDMSALARRLNEVSQRLSDKCKCLPDSTGFRCCHLGMGLHAPYQINALVHPHTHSVVSLQPYCDLIDQVEGSVSALEQTAYRLDAYCKRLGGYYM